MNTKYDGYQRGWRSIMYKFFDKKTGSVATNKNRSNLNQVPDPKIHKSVIKKIQKRKIYSKIIFGVQI